MSQSITFTTNNDISLTTPPIHPTNHTQNKIKDTALNTIPPKIINHNQRSFSASYIIETTDNTVQATNLTDENRSLKAKVERMRHKIRWLEQEKNGLGFQNSSLICQNHQLICQNHQQTTTIATLTNLLQTASHPTSHANASTHNH